MRAAARRDWSTVVLLGPPLFFLLLVFAVPLARVVWGSFFAPDFTLQYYRRMWTVPVYGRVFWITLKISALTTLFCVLLGYPAAYFLASVRPATRQLLLLSVIVPFFLSVLVRNYVWMVLLQRTGLVNRTLLGWNVIGHPLELMYNELGVLIAMVNMLLPYMIFPVLSALLAIPSELTHASASLGAGAVRTFGRRTRPRAGRPRPRGRIGPRFPHRAGHLGRPDVVQLVHGVRADSGHARPEPVPALLLEPRLDGGAGSLGAGGARDHRGGHDAGHPGGARTRPDQLAVAGRPRGGPDLVPDRAEHRVRGGGLLRVVAGRRRGHAPRPRPRPQ